jgi:cyanophycinase
MNDRYLFLLGGNTSLFKAHEAFIAKAGGSNAKIALLIMYSPNWEKYLPHYEKPWNDIGINNYSLIMPDENGNLDINQAKEILDSSTGIFIGGGHTPTYHKYFVTSAMKDLIKEKYDSGIPIAGCSAGALISLRHSFIAPDETKTSDIQSIEGIGLLHDVLIGVHYTENNQQSYLAEAMKRLSINTGLGIDENACAVFKNECLEYCIGKAVHHVYVG